MGEDRQIMNKKELQVCWIASKINPLIPHICIEYWPANNAAKPWIYPVWPGQLILQIVGQIWMQINSQTQYSGI